MRLASSKDPRGLVAPVTVAQQPLVEFSGRQSWQLGLEVDRARYLLARQRLAAELDQLLGEIGTRQNPRHRLHHRFDFLAKIGVGNAEYRGVGDLGMGDQEVLAFLRIDVDASDR